MPRLLSKLSKKLHWLQCLCNLRVTAEAGGDVKINNTIIENKSYPTAYTTASKTASYKVTPLSNDICFLRYDFIKMDLEITATT